MKTSVNDARARLARSGGSLCILTCLVLGSASVARGAAFVTNDSTFTKSGKDVIATFSIEDITGGVDSYGNLPATFCACLMQKNLIFADTDLGCYQLTLNQSDVTQTAGQFGGFGYLSLPITHKFAGAASGKNFYIKITPGPCPAPEPSTMAAFAIGSLVLMGLRMRYRSA
ncbi:hypothetical protein CCAX7_10940 [Capsulimonas corticalis]|uniref:Ice-binding protein C-terminal domain-containing protein n=1 Tax=Capsulimonas corticalis TaxID=2219043 RepID=A0A402CUL3_9BACT|nr:PEP-CTERM sorting domain-containing protein [Capsulimonas corticalis]BDI29043.1 hypothetical protein CCAX7_10940 [Capsulimonas corticalis]